VQTNLYSLLTYNTRRNCN